MNTLKYSAVFVFLSCLITAVQPLKSFAQPALNASGVGPQRIVTNRDGSHDFDFALGTWETHIKRLDHPLTGSHEWVALGGNVVTQEIWDGRSLLEEAEMGTATNHLNSLTAFLYNPHSHQWDLYFADSKDGILSLPSIGEFKDGRGEFIDQESYRGRVILVRFAISNISSSSSHDEQAFSDDGGKTWETNFIANKTQKKQAAAARDVQQAGDKDPAQRAFDFSFGTWKMHVLRLPRGAIKWVPLDGTAVVHKVWGGRANLVEFEINGPSAHIEGLSLNLYNPSSHQWSLNFASSSDGVMNKPTVGEFKDGRGEFYDQEQVNGRIILLRKRYYGITSDSNHFDEAFSSDGGRTWKVNWIATFTKIKGESER